MKMMKEELKCTNCGAGFIIIIAVEDSLHAEFCPICSSVLSDEEESINETEE